MMRCPGCGNTLTPDSRGRARKHCSLACYWNARRAARPAFCAVDDCSLPVRGRGWCTRHYQRWKHHGDPLGGSPRHGPAPKPLIDRVMRRVDALEGGCWLWSGPTVNGYGRINQRDTAAVSITHPAHRITYEHFVAPVPPGHDVHHLCRNRTCVNPEHLELVDHAEHTRRHASEDLSATCRRCGEADWYVSSRGRRRCRVCKNRTARVVRSKRTDSQTGDGR